MSEEKEKWVITTVITTARKFESDVREMVFSLSDRDISVVSMECSHPHRTASIFVQLLLVAETQDLDLAEGFGMRIKSCLSRIAETSTLVTRKTA